MDYILKYPREHLGNICFEDHINWRPDLWKEIVETPPDNETINDELGQLKCTRCAKMGNDCFNTEYTELQTRSGDEAMTIYAHCKTCDKRWKFN